MVAFTAKTGKDQGRECDYCHRRSPIWQFLANPVMPNGIDPLCYRCRVLMEKDARNKRTKVSVNPSLKVRVGESERIRGEFVARWRDRIAERDGGKCVLCLTPDRIVVHHIVPIREGGRNDDANLITLCQKCHGAAHQGRPSRAELHRLAMREPLS